jgi:thiamine biosynthesis protein ThiS
MIAVSRNREIVHREEYSNVVLQAGDAVEIVRMVGGG